MNSKPEESISVWKLFQEKLKHYRDNSEAKAWFEKNYQSIRELFTSQLLLDFVFEPIKEVFVVRGSTPDDEIRAAITRVAVANAVLAGLPGKMGVGVFVSMALEAWMAYCIATRLGVRIDRPADVFKYFGLLAATGVTIIWGFKQMLGVAFSLFGFLGPINPLIPAELLVTNLVGVMFWVGFDEARQRGSFTVPARAVGKIWTETKDLFLFQWEIIRKGMDPDNWKLMVARVSAWFRGEIPREKPELRGELFATVAVAWLLAGKTDRLQGPLGQEFMGAIRDRYPELADATDQEVAQHMAQYKGEQIEGVINLIKGKMFERLEERYENSDGDEWQAYMHDDESFPGSDITFVNTETGYSYEVSLKATDNPEYIEEALQKYPDIPIMTTTEVAEAFPDNESVFPGHYQNAHLTDVTEENFDRLVQDLTPVDAVDAATVGPAAMAGVTLWPFVVAYMRERITYGQLEEACVAVMGEAGKSLAARLSYAILLGPVFAWYLLARGVMGVVKAGESAPVKRLGWSPVVLPA